MENKSVVVTGMGIISAIGNNIPEFASSLQRGKSGIAKISRVNTDGLRSQYGGEIKEFAPEDHFSPLELRRMDRASQISLVAVEEAIQASRLDFSKEERERCGVSLGSTLGGMISGSSYYRDWHQNHKPYASKLLDYPLYSVGTRICIEYGLLGPNYVVSTACSSGNAAIGYALDLIRNGESEIMIAGGFDTMTLLTCAGFGVLRNTSTDQYCRPFDKNRSGLLLGEAAGFVVLEELEHCRKRGAQIWGELRGYGMSSDAYHMTAPDVTGKGPALAMENALADSGIGSEAIDYINAHGTGTLHNDLIETRAIKKVFKDRAYQIPVSSVKSMTGHTLGASGAIELIAAVITLKEGLIPPTINYETPDPNCDLDYVPNTGRKTEVNHILSNNFGFGGNNCAVVVSKYQGV